MRSIFLSFLLLILLNSFSILNAADSVHVVPGKIFERSWYHQQIFGSTWRDVWTTRIKVPILDLNTFAGGLTPIKLGGGQQTKSLRFKGTNGKVYKFRSIEKYTEKLIGKALVNTIVDVLTKDVFSTSNPLSAVITAPIINSVGVLQAQPTIYVLPFDKVNLGKYHEEFAGLLGTLELHPDDSPDDVEDNNFAQADKIFGTYKLFNKLLKDNNYSVNSIEFLKARLLDVYMGDWDRHYDQWRWAVYKNGKKKICHPIPRDRDQAFCRYNGLVGIITREIIPQIETCDEDYPLLSDLTWSGRYLDRKFLSSVNKHQWDSVTTVVHSAITDSVIEHSLSLLPKEIYDKEAANLRFVMKSRRDKLFDASEEYFRELSKYVDIWASNKDEFCSVKRLDDGKVFIQIYKRDKQTGGKKGEPLFSRTFDSKYTSDIRIYLFDGDDKVVLKGKTENSINVRIISGKGRDEIKDKSLVSNSILGIFSCHPNYTEIYDSGNKTKIKKSSSTVVDKFKYPEPKNDTLLFEPPVRDWGHDWKIGGWFHLSDNDGVFVGGGPVLYQFDFRRDPYYYRMHLFAGYSTALDAGRLEYDLKFPVLHNALDFNFNFYYSEIDQAYFYGYGNENELEFDPHHNDYYEIQHNVIKIKSIWTYKLYSKNKIDFGLEYKISLNTISSKELFKNEDPNQFDDRSLLSSIIRYNHDSRDQEIKTQSGFYFDVQSSYTPKLINNINDYSKLNVDFRTYHTFNLFSPTTVAVRSAANKTWGNAPFFDNNYVGGHSLRGYRKERFAGEASLVVNSEVRMHISKFKMIVPGDFGLIGFVDTGRVFYQKEHSTKWHTGYGVGGSFKFVQDDILLSVYYGKSVEGSTVHLKYGFMF